MNDASRAQGGLICVGVAILAALFLTGLLHQSYWALAIPVAIAVCFVLGLVFWVGYTIATIQVEPEVTPQLRERSAGPGQRLIPRHSRCESPCSAIAATCSVGARESMRPTWPRPGGAQGHEVHVIAGPPLPELSARDPAPRDPQLQRLRRRPPGVGAPRGSLLPARAPLPLGARGLAHRRLSGDADLLAATPAALEAAPADATASTSSSTTSVSPGACWGFAPRARRW